MEVYIQRTKEIFSIHQADFYFWVGLGLVLGISEYIIWLLFVVLFIRVVNRIKSRYRYLKLLDEGSLNENSTFGGLPCCW